MESNNKCPCKRKSCKRHGDCDACKKHHHSSKKKVPIACENIKKH